MINIELPAPDDFDSFRAEARRLLAQGIPPQNINWRVHGDGLQDDLFALPNQAPHTQPAGGEPLRVPRAFADLARCAIMHADPHRFALLYRLLWRMQKQPKLADDSADPDMIRVHMLSRHVRRDIHKMRAFVRFREVLDDRSESTFVAWFEPEHHILRNNAKFFMGRFASMRWSILTPRGSLHWSGAALFEGPPAERADAPDGDPVEHLWHQYYASTFNPARLKVGAMLKEMPRKYWHNMPETALIPALVAGARARELAMVQDGANPFEAEEPPRSLDAISTAIAACRNCEIGCNGTRAVSGTGDALSRVMIVGEQPGDQEEQVGQPFVGPAGILLNTALDQAGIARESMWLTNAVKHFKYQAQGKRRLHQNPAAREIDVCRWWLDSERTLIQPRLILALGASAGRAIIGRTPSVKTERGLLDIDASGAELWLTVHPAYLLRLDGKAFDREMEAFTDDLSRFAARIRELSE
jgi:uracil-DNA glycosylase